MAETLPDSFKNARPGGGFGGPQVGLIKPYEISKELRPMAEKLNMLALFEDMKTKGYCVIPPTPETEQLADIIRADVMRIGDEQVKNKDKRGTSTPRLLGHPDVTMLPDGTTAFEKILMEPRLACLAEYMCGAGFILSQHTASRKTAKIDAMVAKMDKHGRGYAPALHADQSWMPSPFPEHNLFLTACFVTDDGYETRDGGATCIVPGSHFLKKFPPTHDEGLMEEAYKRLKPIIAKKGSWAVWDGSVWHAGGWRKQEESARVVVHTTFSRMYVRPVEEYKNIIGDDILARNPPLMAQLVGRDDWLSHRSMVSRGRKFLKTYGMALNGTGGVVHKLDWENFTGKVDAGAKL